LDDPCETGERELKELRTLIQNNLAVDNIAHERIEESLSRVITAHEVQLGVAAEKEKGESSLKKQVFALLLLLLAQTAAGTSWIVAKFDRVETDILNNTAHYREYQAIGNRWGHDIDARAVKIQSDIAKIRERLNSHLQHNHHRASPGKE
jgi:hypothetical protein